MLVIMPKAASNKKFECFMDVHYVLCSFENLTVVYDLIILYEDWNASSVHCDMLQIDSHNLSFPIRVVPCLTKRYDWPFSCKQLF